MTATTAAAAAVPGQLTLAPQRCTGPDCDVATYSPAQVRRWPHLSRYPVVDLDDTGRCPSCARRLAEARAAIAAQVAEAEAAEDARLEAIRASRVAGLVKARAAQAAKRAAERSLTPESPDEQTRRTVAAERKRRQRDQDAVRRPGSTERRRWALEDSQGPRGLRRVVVRGIVRWVEQ